MISSTWTPKFRQWLIEENRSAQTAALYDSHIRRILQLSDPLAAVRNPEAAPKTRHSTVAALRAWAQFTGDADLTDRLKRMSRTLPKADHLSEKKPLTLDERDRFLLTLDRSEERLPIKVVIGVMATRGLRVGDVLRLTRKEIASAVEDEVLFGTAKGGRRKRYEITEDTIEYLKLLLALKGWDRVEHLVAPAVPVAPGVEERSELRRRQTAVQAVERACARLSKKAKLRKVVPHLFRATYARLYLDSVGGDITYLTHHMGWESAQTALGYVENVDPKREKSAAEGIRRKR